MKSLVQVFAARLFTRFMGFSLLSGTKFFAVLKNAALRSNQPPAMRARVDCYTKKSHFRYK